MTDPRVSELTVTEFKELVRETVAQSLAEMLGDPDEGLVLRDDFSKALRRSLREVRDGGPTRSLADVADSLDAVSEATCPTP